MSDQNEASVEEILESIKKVIARDNRDSAMEMRRRRETEGVVQSVPITDHEDGERGYDASDAEEVLDLGELDYVEGMDEPEDDSDGEAVETPLTSDNVRESMRDNFAALAMLSEPGAKPQIVRSGETSLEGLVREMLRPMLAEWLDKNLPGMVEKMVQAEIARIAGKRG